MNLEITSLPPECEEGNVEYKRKLSDDRPDRFIKLVSQLKWRIKEGQGKCYYFLGVEDNGKKIGIDKVNMEKSLKTLHKMAKAVKAGIVNTKLFPIDPQVLSSKKYAHVTIRRDATSDIPEEVRVIILGTSCGKTTLVSALSLNLPDNGTGFSRTHILKHKHELDNGHTSCVTPVPLYFDSNLRPKLSKQREISKSVLFDYDSDSLSSNGFDYSSQKSLEQTFIPSEKVVCLVDVAGDIKYIKSTNKGIISYEPHYCMYCIAANEVLNLASSSFVNFLAEPMNTNLLSIIRIMNKSVFFVVTKMDQINFTEQILLKFEQGLRFLTILSGFKPSIEFCFFWSNACESKQPEISNERIPVFLTSSLENEHFATIDELRSFLGKLDAAEVVSSSSSILHLREAFNLGDRMVVAGGVCESGSFNVGDLVKVGPNSNAQYDSLIVGNILTAEGLRVSEASAGKSACLAFELPSKTSARRKYSRSYKNVLLQNHLPQETKDILSIVNDFSTASLVSSLYTANLGQFNEYSDDEDGETSVHKYHAIGEKVEKLKYDVLKRIIRKGAVVVKGLKGTTFTVVREFEVELKYARKSILDLGLSELKVQENWNFMAYVNAIKQTVFVINRRDLENGNQLVKLRFMQRSEFLEEGSVILLSRGVTVALGIVSKTYKFKL
eukprot:maker-scaffold_39-snap-gene-2.79-mRNA-1 protein AED:0.00 eAED:0.00 QI:51/1/1/1/1/1/2/23/666